MVFETECAVIGAGVVGLAVARALARAGRDVVVVEAAEAIGTGVSSRNSEVIHAGIYFPPEAWKTRLCVAGRRMLYDYCAERGIPHKRCGKLIVANGDAEEAALRALIERGRVNGVTDLVWLEGAQARALEPALRASAAALSPSTGTVDSHAFMLSLQGDAERAGAVVALNSPVVGGRVERERTVLAVGGAEPMELGCRWIVNCAGLGSWGVARAIEGFPLHCLPPRHLAKGTYFAISGHAPFSRLIYPMPLRGGLGVHLTSDLGGRTRFGPDVEWVDAESYDVDPERANVFYAAVRSYWPDLPDGALRPDYAGVRPKIQGPQDPPQDFALLGPATLGLSGHIHLFGIESPGLTSSLAIAERVCRMMA